jgi:hypothetical protein
MGKAVRIEAPIEGALGNTVNVGDTVMVVTTGWSTTVTKGKYLGYIEGSGYYKVRAQVEVQERTYERLWNDTKQPVNYSDKRWEELTKSPDYYTAYQKETHVVTVPYKRVTTLNLNRIATIKE